MNRFFVAILVSITGSALIFSGCSFYQSADNNETNSENTNSSNIEDVSSLEIYYAYGVEEKNILDTANDSFTKDMVCDPAREYPVKITAADRQALADVIAANDFFSLADEYTDGCDAEGQCAYKTPLVSATLRITADGRTKTVRTNDNYFDRDSADFAKITAIETALDDLIVEKTKGLSIPEPRCGYL